MRASQWGLIQWWSQEKKESGNVSLAWKRGAWRKRQTAINAGGENHYWNRSPFTWRYNHVSTCCSSLCPHRQPPDPAVIILTPSCSFELHQLPYTALQLPSPLLCARTSDPRNPARLPPAHLHILKSLFYHPQSLQTPPGPTDTLWSRHSNGCCFVFLYICWFKADERTKLHLLVVLI